MHVFVETNWVFDCFAPRHRRTPAAQRILSLASSAQCALHVPAIALTEAAETIRRTCQPKGGDVVGWFKFAREQKMLPPDVEQHVRFFLNEHDRHVKKDLEGLDDELDRLSKQPGVDVFHLTEAAFERIAQIRPAALKPYDEAILAAILNRASEICQGDNDTPFYFCTLDSDLHPNDKKILAQLYDPLRILVRSDFDVPLSREA